MKYLLLAFLFISILPTVLFAQTPVHKSLVGVSGWVIFNDPDNVSLVDFEKYAYWTDRVYFEAYECGEDGMPSIRAEATDAMRARAVAAAKKGKCQAWMVLRGSGTAGSHTKTANGLDNILSDGTLRQQHIAKLMAMAKADQVDGIQVKYFDFGSKKRGAFVGYLGELATACHQNGLLLGAMVRSKNEDWGEWWGLQEFDYAGIGKAVDEMVPSPSSRGDADLPGPMADLVWQEVVMRYMTSLVPASKTEVSAPAHGFDWAGLHGQGLTWAQFQNILLQYKVTPGRDTEVSEELYLNYPPNHEVWFADAKSAEFAADIAKRLQTYGIAFDRFGTEGLEFWQMVRRADSSPQATGPVGMPPFNPVPRKLLPIDIYTDSRRELNIWASGGEDPNQSNITAIEKGGRKWLDVNLNPAVWSNFGIDMAATNLKDYLAHGALQFYIKGSQGGENFAIGFQMAPGLKKEEMYHFQDTVPLNNYGEVTTQWKLVTIPLSDFPVGGNYEDFKCPFNWTRVNGIIAQHPNGNGAPCEFQISNMRVVPSFK